MAAKAKWRVVVELVTDAKSTEGLDVDSDAVADFVDNAIDYTIENPHGEAMSDVDSIEIIRVAAEKIVTVV